MGRAEEGKGIRLTCLQETHSSCLQLFAQLPCFLQVLQHIDDGGKEHHVLLSTAMGHLHQLVQVLQHCAHDVTWTDRHMATDKGDLMDNHMSVSHEIIFTCMRVPHTSHRCSTHNTAYTH